MANRFFSPNQQFADSTGLPYANGSLTFYASGTSTPLATYSDRALTIANTNPVALDSAGRAGAIFLQNLAYKVVLSDSNNNPIWTMDPVYSSDFSTTAAFLSGSGSPNGSVAGTAGSATIPASSYWDFTNNILYICTQTGTSSTAVWSAINSGSVANVVVVPQGYLTPTSGTPVIPSDAISVSQLYYTPFQGNQIPIYNGTSFIPTTFAELGLSLVSQHQANNIYDVFVFNNGGVLTLATGPAWSNSAAGTGARGTGAGTTQLSRLNGFWVNTVSMTGRNGSTTYTIPASQATFVGSILIDSVAAQISCLRGYGQNRRWGISNAYNRQKVVLQSGDSTASWSGSNVWRATNGNSANQCAVLCCLPEESVSANFGQNWSSVAANNGVLQHFGGIGINSTTAPTGKIGEGQIVNQTGSGTNITLQANSVASAVVTPFLGLSNIFSLENTSGSTTAITITGGINNCLLTTEFKA